MIGLFKNNLKQVFLIILVLHVKIYFWQLQRFGATPVIFGTNALVIYKMTNSH